MDRGIRLHDVQKPKNVGVAYCAQFAQRILGEGDEFLVEWVIKVILEDGYGAAVVLPGIVLASVSGYWLQILERMARWDYLRV